MIKRPLVLWAAAYIIGNICCRYGISLKDIIPAVIFLTVAGFIFLSYTSYKLSKNVNHYNLVFLFIPFLCIMGYMGLAKETAACTAEEMLEGRYVSLTGRVEYIKGTEGNYKLYVEVYPEVIRTLFAETAKEADSDIRKNSAVNTCGLIMAAVDTLHYEKGIILPGDEVTVSGEAAVFIHASNPGQFDEYNYYKSENVCFKVYADSLSVVNKYNSDKDTRGKVSGIDKAVYSIRAGMFMLKDKMMRTLYDAFTAKNYGNAAALMLGEKSVMDSEIKELYQDNGIMHIMSISGMHISLILSGILCVLKKSGAGRNNSLYAGMPAIALYAVMINAGASAKRAVIMSVVSCVATLCGFVYDMPSSMSLAAMLILKDYPLKLYDSGFLLSFGAVLAISMVYPVISAACGKAQESITEKKRNKKEEEKENIVRYIRTKADAVLHGAGKSMMFGMCIQLVTMPVLFNVYYFVPVYSVFLNLVVIPLLTVAAVSVAACAIIGAVIPVAAGVLSVPAEMVFDLYTYLCGLTDSMPGNRFETGILKPYIIIIYYIVLFTGIYFVKKNPVKKSLCLFVLLPAVIILNGINTGIQITFLDVGQGDCIYIEADNGEVIFVDGGSTSKKNIGKNIIIPFLESEGKSKADYVFVTHGDSDHISGIKELIKENKAGCLILASTVTQSEGYQSLLSLAGEYDTEVVYIRAGDMVNIGNISFLCIAPAEAYSDCNEESLSLFTVYGEFTMLLTGDCDEAAEKKYIEKYKAILRGAGTDVYKAAHHGSGYSNSEALFEVISPEDCVISCGKDNSYGHPHSNALERIENSGADIHITYMSGAVTIYSDGKNYSIDEYLN